MLSRTAEAGASGNHANHTNSLGKRNPAANEAADPRVWQLHWRRQLNRLAALDLPLLAVGAGPDRKAPANLRNGELLTGWTTAKHTTSQLDVACKRVIAAGTRTGKDAHGFLAFDIDGETGVSYCLERGCDPAETPTWQVHRNTDESRLKTAFRLSEDQQQQLGQIKATQPTKDAVKDDAGNVIEKGEAVELFHGTGQVIVLGQHWPSKGFYFWPDGMGPEALAPIPESWWQLALEIAGNAPTKTPTTKSTGKGDWRSLNPCTICGRDTTGFCSQHKDGKTIRCFHGNTFAPPAGLRRGEEITDKQGTVWAFSKTQVQNDGNEFSVFVEPDPDRRRNTTENAKTATPPRPTAPAAEGGYSRPSRLETHQVMELLPKRIGKVRLNVRSGEVIAQHRDGPITLSGNDIGRLYLQLSSQAEKWPKETTADAVALLASQAPFDPVADYLNSNATAALPMEQWQRLDKHLLGIDDPIAAAFLPRYLISAVARVFQPGCYVRQSPVLIGKQERGKSEMGRILFGAEHWVEGIGELGKDDLMKAHTAWGVELAELDGVTRRADQEALKAFLIETTDTYRKPYDRAPEAHQRRFVFWGTSNGAPLRDATGSTRYVCIPIPDRLLPLDWARQNRSALWARAVEQYRAGANWIEIDEPMRASIAERNSNFQEIDPWAEEIGEYLAQEQLLGHVPVRVSQVLSRLQVPKERQNTATAKRVTAIAEQLGWAHGRRRLAGGEKTQGLWPAATGHPGHGAGTHRGAQPNSSDSNGSDQPGTPGTPIHKHFEKTVRAQEPTTQPRAPQPTTPDTFDSIRVPGAPIAETPCTGKDFSSGEGCPEECPEGCPDQNWPVWLPDLLAIRDANPGQLPSIYANELMAKHQVPTDGRTVKALLKTWDATHPKTVSNAPG